MILKNSKGHVVYETRHKTIKETLEYCAKNKIDLTGISLRGAAVRHANLDGLCAPNAILWGCNFKDSDMGYANFKNCDFRASSFENVCFAHSDLSKSDMRGAAFYRNILDGATLDNIQVSCAEFWHCNISLAASAKNIIFLHKGEQAILVSEIPLIFHHKDHPVIVLGEYCLWRGEIFLAGSLPDILQKDIFLAKVILEKCLKSPLLQNAI